MTIAAVSARPIRALGAPPPGGLALPAANPTASHLYGPRGVWTDGTRVAVADTGNHRVLIWHSPPAEDASPADVVLGQRDFATEGPAAGGRGPERGMSLPTGIGMVGGRLVVADAWHHRLLVWDGLPETSDAPADLVIGQGSAAGTEPNGGREPNLASFRSPFGFGEAGGRFWVCDTGNRRVLGWDGLPEPGRPADVLLGQDVPAECQENRGGPVGPASFRWPHDVSGDSECLLVADAGNHRLLGWTPPPAADRNADLVLGQPDPVTASEFPYGDQGPDRLRFPYACSLREGLLAVADTANNRVLLWEGLPAAGAGVPARAVLGQRDFGAHGENRWEAVAPDTFCWPYGLCFGGDLLAVADSGNNRVVLWRVEGGAA